MLIRLKSQLHEIENGMSGTLVVINGSMDFKKTDGYIQFMGLALGNIGPQAKGWQECIDRVKETAGKLCDSNTRYSGGTKEDFRVYCENTSHILETGSTSLESLTLQRERLDNLVPFMEKCIDEGRSLGFYYGKDEDPAKGLTDDIMNQLNRLKFGKGDRQTDISWFLTKEGYHEHIHDALNVLLQAATYAMNCTSTRENECYDFDIMEITNRLDHAQSIIERIQYLV